MKGRIQEKKRKTVKGKIQKKGKENGILIR